MLGGYLYWYLIMGVVISVVFVEYSRKRYEKEWHPNWVVVTVIVVLFWPMLLMAICYFFIREGVKGS